MKGEKIEIMSLNGMILVSNLSFNYHTKKMIKTTKYNLINCRGIRHCISVDAAKTFR